MRHLIVLVSVVTALAISSAVPAAGLAAQTETGTTSRVSVDSRGQQTSQPSSGPSVSAEGNIVAFTSDASDLVGGDTNNAHDVFVRDRAAGITTRVSVGSSGQQASEDSFAPAVSADGNSVAFLSEAPDLVPGDTNNTSDVFVRDLDSGTTTLVSVGGQEQQANGPSGGPSVSADGSAIVFNSNASNLVPGDTNGGSDPSFSGSDVFVRDRVAGTTTRVNVDNRGQQTSGDIIPQTASVSADGIVVVFESGAKDLVASDTNNAFDVFVRDRAAGTTRRISVDSNEQQANRFSRSPSISADGDVVAFSSGASNLVSSDNNRTADVFVRDRAAGTTTRVSVNTSRQQGRGRSEFPSISADGNTVSFTSRAANLVAGDTNRAADIFLRDRDRGTTTRVSVNSRGQQASDYGRSSKSSVSADGGIVAFDSLATNLVPRDTNGTIDVFVRDREGS